MMLVVIGLGFIIPQRKGSKGTALWLIDTYTVPDQKRKLTTHILKLMQMASTLGKVIHNNQCNSCLITYTGGGKVLDAGREGLIKYQLISPWSFNIHRQ